MAEMVKSTTSSGPRAAEANLVTRFFRATEIDTRLLGMIGALIIIWIGDINLSLLICAWLVAFFPVLSNTAQGLHSTDTTS